MTMAKRIYGYISRTINSLTKDEDVRQELWLYIIEGNSPYKLQSHYETILKTQEIENGFKEKLQRR